MTALDTLRRNLTGYLFSTETCATKTQIVTSASVLVIWVSCAVVVSARHVPFRDEVRALSVALEPRSVWQLPIFLKNEGHPVLWYLILRLGFVVTHTYASLKIAAVLVGFAAVVVFFRFAPFPVWQKILFLPGVLPLWEYTVKSRNYGISMLLLFLFAYFYARRRRNPILLALLLVALSNANIHSCILASILLSVWLFEDIVIERAGLTVSRILVLSSASAIVIAGLLFAFLTVLPDHSSIVIKDASLSVSRLAHASLLNVKHPGLGFDLLFVPLPHLLRDLLVWLLIAGLLVRVHLAVALFIGLVSFGTFSTTIGDIGLRHQGLLFIFLLSLYWIAPPRSRFSSNTVSARNPSPRQFVHRIATMLIIPLVLVVHITFSATEIGTDLSHAASSSAAFARFLDTRREYQRAIVIGEPDYLLESLPYYASNRIYIPREEQFRTYVMFTTASKATMSLATLLHIAQRVQHQEGQPVLIAFGHRNILDECPGVNDTKHYSYNKVITWSAQEVADFHKDTVKVAEFDSASTDENYAVYSLRANGVRLYDNRSTPLTAIRAGLEPQMPCAPAPKARAKEPRFNVR